MIDRITPTPQPRVIYAPAHPDGPDAPGAHVRSGSAPPPLPANPPPPERPRPMAQIITSAADPVRNILVSILPRDDSSFAVSTALDAVARERRAAAYRHDTAQHNRRRALTDSRADTSDIELFGRQAAEAAIEIERLDVVKPDLEEKLQAALCREAAAREEFLRAVAAHEAQAAELAKALPGYEAAAVALIKIAELAHALDASTDYIRRAAAVAGMAIPPSPSTCDTTFLKNLVVPSRGNGKPLWGTMPPYQSTHPYANSGRGPHG